MFNLLYFELRSLKTGVEMEEIRVDLAIIGSGPGGQKAAIQAAKLGKKVAIIEKDSVPGGACLNSGTIPSKSLRAAIVDLTEFHSQSFYGKDQCTKDVSINDLNYRLNKVLEEQRRVIARQFRKNDIRLIYGTARFENRNTLIVVDDDFRLCCQIQADYIVIASGSKPRNPIHVPFDDEVILDSTRLLSIDKLPRELIVLGGGIIGSEYASFFAALGSKVTVVDKKDHMLPLLDAEIGVHLQAALSEFGVSFVGNAKPEKIYREGNRAIVELENGNKIEGDALLYALGRVGNVDALHIDNAGIQINQRGDIPVNPLYQTVTSNIYAVGDVIGFPALASTSMEQGRLAARHAFGAEVHNFPNLFPIGIYTIPEISCCGYTEDELQELGFNYEVGRAYYYELAKGHITGSKDGLLKILFHAETLEVLGVHIIGRGATENIHIGQMAMSFHARVDYFINQVFNYPTFAEAYRVAALNGYNKIKHKR